MKALGTGDFSKSPNGIKVRQWGGCEKTQVEKLQTQIECELQSRSLWPGASHADT